MPTPQVHASKANPPIAETVRLLAQLRSQHRQGWRCLQTLQSFTDFSHLARRLHLSHESLRALLHQLSAQLGDQHMTVVSGEVRLSHEMQQALAQLRGGSLVGGDAPEQSATASRAGADRSHS